MTVVPDDQRDHAARADTGDHHPARHESDAAKP